MNDRSTRKQPYPYDDAPRLSLQGAIEVSKLTQEGPPDELEIGPGRGTFIVERAAEVPGLRIVGLEIRWKWATLVDNRLARLGFGARARVYAEDARFVLPRFEPAASVKAVYIHFPDPWWKTRQRKRLVVASAFVDALARILQPGGMLFVQTDVEERAFSYEALIDAHSDFVRDGDCAASARCASVPWTAMTNREKRAVKDGIPVVRLRYKRRGA